MFVDDWLARIGLADRPDPTVDALGRIVRQQLRSITFENLTVVSGMVPDLDDEALAAKLITRRRGGYCFELNGLLARGLRALGYEVTPLMARVMFNKAGLPGARSHLFLRVEAEGAAWLADAGFGGSTPDALVPLGAGRASGDGQFVLHDEPGLGTVLSRQNPTGDAVALYAFTEELVGPADVEAANWLMATWPQSPFRARLVAALGDRNERRTLAERTYRLVSEAGKAIETELRDPEALSACLSSEFGLDLTEAEHEAATQACFPSGPEGTAPPNQ